MRSLQRNWRELYYAVPSGTEAILDEYGNETLEVKQLYGAPTRLLVNVSPGVGQEAVEMFGAQTEYSRSVVYIGDKCPMPIGSRVWFGVPITGPHNYTVVKVADTKWHVQIALREVSPRG